MSLSLLEWQHIAWRPTIRVIHGGCFCDMGMKYKKKVEHELLSK
jgi:hypothetical protein